MDVLALFREAASVQVDTIQIGVHTFHVRGMDATHRAVFLRMLAQAIRENSQIPDHVIVAWGLCNPDGSPLPGTTEEKLEALRNLDGKALNAAARKIMDISGFGSDAVESAEKNGKPAGAPIPVPAGAGDGQDGRPAAS